MSLSNQEKKLYFLTWFVSYHYHGEEPEKHFFGQVTSIDVRYYNKMELEDDLSTTKDSVRKSDHTKNYKRGHISEGLLRGLFSQDILISGGRYDKKTNNEVRLQVITDLLKIAFYHKNREIIKKVNSLLRYYDINMIGE